MWTDKTICEVDLVPGLVSVTEDPARGIAGWGSAMISIGLAAATTTHLLSCKKWVALCGCINEAKSRALRELGRTLG